jgi:transcriptional regulator with XRE-family HTH domain
VLASRLKLLRKQMGLSLQELADSSGLTKSYVSKVERGISTPSIATAMKLAGALRIDVNQLFVAAGHDDGIAVIRASERVVVGGNAESLHSRYEVISRAGGGHSLVPFMISPAKVFTETDFKEHDGEEFIFVHRGKIEIDFSNQKVTLSAGDAVHFNARIPHRIRSLGRTQAEVLLVVAND